ncbi:iron-sulfur cluster assembly protein [Ensifer soli]|uniref:iron-sulfur cluster assembly protein n=1 Tax=Ciceribacter sp. sgz301302 TaxID=3342379 RepID=UPI0035B74B81
MDSLALDERRRRELWRQLATVNDPELDEAVTEMGFIDRAEIDGSGAVAVDFRLPTYWCSPNFAFLMLEDLRNALAALSWQPSFRITLHDHMFAEEVNKGIAEGRGFSEIFGALAEKADLEALREKFRRKAFQRRQEAVILALRAAGLSDEAVVGLTLAGLDAVRGVDGTVVARYREIVRIRFPQRTPEEAAIVDLDGGAVDAAGLVAHLADLRSVRINMEFNGALCRGLKGTRYKEVDRVDGEPTLVDFIAGRVPAQGRPAVI